VGRHKKSNPAYRDSRPRNRCDRDYYHHSALGVGVDEITRARLIICSAMTYSVTVAFLLGGSVHPRSNLRRPKGKPIGQVIEPLFCPRGEFLRRHCRWSSHLNKHSLQLSPTTALSGIGGRETNYSRLKPKRARHAEQSQPKGYLPETRRSM